MNKKIIISFLLTILITSKLMAFNESYSTSITKVYVNIDGYVLIQSPATSGWLSLPGTINNAVVKAMLSTALEAKSSGEQNIWLRWDSDNKTNGFPTVLIISLGGG